MTGFLQLFGKGLQFAFTGAGGSGINEVKNVVRKLQARVRPLGGGGSTASGEVPSVGGSTVSGEAPSVCVVSLAYKSRNYMVNTLYLVNTLYIVNTLNIRFNTYVELILINNKISKC